ncbi:hypothetical protein [Nocardia aurantiaca]|uniref:Uncharacterized protein n=1 Tax=Nocardia aurantiaca TaxID=2675850 RepID=A0A6I3L7F2_9NOCA|nr:hypothetical protein [Nocardia aurantiaca]MTE17461.1 hypothetical protein [Nocardia aurantiaca]
MTRGMNASPDMQERMPELAALLRECREATMRLSAAERWEPHQGSAAARDIAVFEKTEGLRDPRTVLEVVGTYLELATWHAGGMAATLEAHEALAAPWPLARSVLEACARAAWVIGDPFPPATERNRLARAYIENLISAEQEGNVTRAVHGAGSEAAMTFRNANQQLRDEIRAVFPDTKRSDLDHKRVNGIAPLSLAGSATWYFETMHQLGAIGTDPSRLKSIYTMLSNHAHPTLYTFRQRREYFQDGKGLSTRLVVQPSELDRLVTLTVMTVYITMKVVCRYCRWPFDADGQFEAMIDRYMPNAFMEPHPSVTLPDGHSI